MRNLYMENVYTGATWIAGHILGVQVQWPFSLIMELKSFHLVWLV